MSTATSSMAAQAEAKQRPWWITLIEGILALVIGAVLLWAPAKTKVDTYTILVAFLGIYSLVDGIMNIVAIFIDHTMWGWKLFIGIVSILAGAAILMYPIAAAIQLPQVFALVLGIWGLMYGVVLLIMAFRGAGWAAGILGALGILFGLALTLNYYVLGMGLSMLWSAAVCGVIGGIVLIVQAFRQRSA